jgi:hypothetical protein
VTIANVATVCRFCGEWLRRSPHETHDAERLEPASTTVPATATKQENENYNDKKRVGIHVRLPSI